MRRQRSLSADDRFHLAKRFAKMLGWQSLRRLQHTSRHFAGNSGPPDVFIWYEAGQIGNPRTDCFLQLNEWGADSTKVMYSGAVYAVRYRICTGWHNIGPLQDEPSTTALAKEWQQWFDRRIFLSLRGRRQFRERHPECAGYSWTTIRRAGPPYAIEIVRRRGKTVLNQVASERCRQFLKRFGGT